MKHTHKTKTKNVPNRCISDQVLWYRARGAGMDQHYETKVIHTAKKVNPLDTAHEKVYKRETSRPFLSRDQNISSEHAQKQKKKKLVT